MATWLLLTSMIPLWMMSTEAQTVKPYQVVVLSDLNGSYGSTTYKPRVHDAVNWITQTLKPQVVISTGDMIAGQRKGLEYLSMWRAFHKTVTTPLTKAGIPFAPSPGNHDASGYRAFRSERRLYMKQWDAHRPKVNFVEDTYYPLYYAYTVGPALFVSLDDTLVGDLGTPQRLWLEGVLKQHKDKALTFVYGHLPLFPVAQGREHEILHDPKLEKMLKRYNVNAFISGHHHAYYPGKRDGLGLVHTGCLGSGPRKLVGDTQRSLPSAVVLRFNAQGQWSVEAYTGSGMTQRIPRSTLPPMLTHMNQSVIRDDL